MARACELRLGGGGGGGGGGGAGVELQPLGLLPSWCLCFRLTPFSVIAVSSYMALTSHTFVERSILVASPATLLKLL